MAPLAARVDRTLIDSGSGLANMGQKRGPDCALMMRSSYPKLSTSCDNDDEDHGCCLCVFNVHYPLSNCCWL